MIRALRVLRVGSPPPMWGKGERYESIALGDGITPTHVGKSLKTGSCNALCRDHPHPCGEKSIAFIMPSIDLGSPPPMWGKVHTLYCRAGFLRITPTHVGKSISAALKGAARQDHPHPCGEKKRRYTLEIHRPGSPPPMWGKENACNSV